jgi:hypothetical protein
VIRGQELDVFLAILISDEVEKFRRCFFDVSEFLDVYISEKPDSLYCIRDVHQYQFIIRLTRFDRIPQVSMILAFDKDIVKMLR